MDAKKCGDDKSYFCLVNLGVLADMVNNGSFYSEIPEKLKKLRESLEESYKRQQGLPSYEFRLQSAFYVVKSSLQKRAIEQAFNLLKNNPQGFQRCIDFIWQSREMNCLSADIRSVTACDKCFYSAKFQHLYYIRQVLIRKYEEIKTKK